jgi:hypothetical protein
MKLAAFYVGADTHYRIVEKLGGGGAGAGHFRGRAVTRQSAGVAVSSAISKQ